MAYNTTSWGTDTNTNAPTGGSLTTTNHQYKSMQGVFANNNSSTLQFVAFVQLNTPSQPNVYNAYTWATSGNLVKYYYVPSQLEGDMTGTTLTIKAYRYRPDGSNTGDVDTIGNWTELNTATCTPSSDERGVLATFTEADCSYNTGDLMCISVQSTHDDYDGNTEIYGTIIIKEDWNNIIDGNI
jgi:hypothetical protein